MSKIHLKTLPSFALWGLLHDKTDISLNMMALSEFVLFHTENPIHLPYGMKKILKHMRTHQEGMEKPPAFI